jgi:hypothetical protein
MSKLKAEKGNDNEDSPIFIVGMPRSGTTLLSKILSSHSNICIAPESHFLNYWMQRFSFTSIQEDSGFEEFWQAFIHSERFSYFEIDSTQLFSVVKFASEDRAQLFFSTLLKQFSKKEKKSRWGEKTPAHYAYIDKLLEWYPNARILYVVRDPRAVAASMKNVPWGGNRVIAYSTRWKDSIKHLKKWVCDYRVLKVQYEHFVINPEKYLRQICSFIGEDFQSQLLTSDKLYNDSTAKLYSSEWAISHVFLASQSINTDNLEKWKKNLSENEIALIEYICRNYMKDFNYKALGKHPSFIWKLYLWIYLLGRQGNSYVGKQKRLKMSFPKWA